MKQLYSTFTTALVLIAGSFISPVSADNQPNYGILLKTGTVLVEPTPDLAQAMRFDAAEVVNNQYYRYIQFYQTPTSAERAALEASGISFLYYLPHYTYAVSIPAGLSASVWKQGQVRAIIPIESSYKLDPKLLKNDLPRWALTEPGTIDLVVSYAPDIETGILNELIDRHGLNVLYRHDYLKTMKVRVSLADIEATAALPFVLAVEPIDPPSEPENFNGRTLHRSNVMNTDYDGGRKYDGAGVVVGLQDDGIIGPHIDHQGRLLQNMTNNGGNHGDHTGGIIASAGNRDPRGRGQAPGVMLHTYNANGYVLIDSMVPHYNSREIVITSTSYSNGCNAGYTDFARLHDQLARTLPSLLHVFSAGNLNGQDCGYGAGGQWGNVTGGHKQAKNVVTVASLQGNAVISGFSSRGPAHDGRIKPDISGKGQDVFSCMDPHIYQTISGTSMSCPGVAGSVADLYQAYKQYNGGMNPPSSLIKAAILNGANDIGNPGPDFIHGYGVINNLRAVTIIEDGRHLTGQIDQGQMMSHQITVPAETQEVSVLICWTDYEAATGAVIALVNDIDIQVLDPAGSSYDPWVLDHSPVPASLNSPATRGTDRRNNVEKVSIDAPAAGDYTVNVTGFNIPMGPQEYHIVYEFRTDKITLTYPIGGEPLVPGESEWIRWDAYSEAGIFTLDYSTDNGATWNLISANIPGNARMFNWPVPNNINGLSLVRISRGAEMDMSQAAFTMSGVPGNIVIDSVCPDHIALRWTGTTGASGYEVMALGQKYMDSVAFSNTTSAMVYGLNPMKEQWFTVRSHLPDGGIGRRAVAVLMTGGISGCRTPDDAGMASINSPSGGALFDCFDNSAIPVTITIENNATNNITDVPVFYQLDGGTVVSETYIGTLAPGATATHTFAQTIDLSLAGLHTLNTWLSYTGDVNRWNDSLTNEITTQAGTLVNLPFYEDFEGWPTCGTAANCATTVCNLQLGWFNGNNGDADDIDFRINAGPTPSTGTGPTVDYDPGTASGNYAYLEASACFNMTAMMHTPCVDLTGATNPYLGFAYHMFGAGMGQLHVDVFSGSAWTLDVWSISGDQGDQWHCASVNLALFRDETVMVRFRGFTGATFTSDICIDGVGIADMVPPTAAITSSVNRACEGDPVTFTGVTTGNPQSWNWNFGAGATPPAATTGGPHTVTYTGPGPKNVTFSVRNLVGCDESTHTITVEAQPSAGFNYTQTGPTIVFTNTSSNATSFSWNFGDGNSSTALNPTHTYTTNGTYNITLTVSNDCGTRTITQTINVTGVALDQVSLSGLNIQISPNPSDGVFNLEISGVGSSLELEVYDLHGKLLIAEHLLISDTYRRSLDLGGFAKGVYHLKLISSEQEIVRKLTIQ